MPAMPLAAERGLEPNQARAGTGYEISTANRLGISTAMATPAVRSAPQPSALSTAPKTRRRRSGHPLYGEPHRGCTPGTSERRSANRFSIRAGRGAPEAQEALPRTPGGLGALLGLDAATPARPAGVADPDPVCEAGGQLGNGFAARLPASESDAETPTSKAGRSPSVIAALLPEGAVPPLTSARKLGRRADSLPGARTLAGRFSRLQQRWEQLHELATRHVHGQGGAWAPTRTPTAVVRVVESTIPVAASGLRILLCKCAGCCCEGMH